MMYNKKSSDPEIEPCCTPYLIKCSDEKEFLIWHFGFRLVRKNLSKFIYSLSFYSIKL